MSKEVFFKSDKFEVTVAETTGYSDEKIFNIYLPHSCDEWIIGEAYDRNEVSYEQAKEALDKLHLMIDELQQASAYAATYVEKKKDDEINLLR